jgi:hypothetical protein
MPQRIRTGDPEEPGPPATITRARGLQQPVGAHHPLHPLAVDRQVQLSAGQRRDQPRKGTPLLKPNATRGRARLLCGDAPRGKQREQRDRGEHHERGTKSVEPCLLVDVEDRLRGFLAQTRLVEPRRQVRVRDERHGAGELRSRRSA